MVTVPEFLFVCAPSSLLQGPLPNNVQGIVGLGHTPLALPTQLASRFGLQPQFALCLTSSNKGNGAIFFGNWPYKTLPGIDFSVPVSYTPLTISPQGEYYIQVKSTKINYKLVPLDMSIFSRNERGFGRISICTTPYTVLEHSIFIAFTQFFTNQLSGVPWVDPMSPFTVCFDSKNLKSTRVGPRVPNIDFVFNWNVSWRIFGANSMVQAQPGVSCLGFVDGGLKP